MSVQCPLLLCVIISSSIALQNLNQTGWFIAWWRWIVSPTWFMSAIRLSIMSAISYGSTFKLTLQSSMMLHSVRFWLFIVLASQILIIIVLGLIIWLYLDFAGSACTFFPRTRHVFLGWNGWLFLIINIIILSRDVVFIIWSNHTCFCIIWSCYICFCNWTFPIGQDFCVAIVKLCFGERNSGSKFWLECHMTDCCYMLCPLLDCFEEIIKIGGSWGETCPMTGDKISAHCLHVMVIVPCKSQLCTMVSICLFLSLLGSCSLVHMQGTQMCATARFFGHHLLQQIMQSLSARLDCRVSNFAFICYAYWKSPEVCRYCFRPFEPCLYDQHSCMILQGLYMFLRLWWRCILCI